MFRILKGKTMKKIGLCLLLTLFMFSRATLAQETNQAENKTSEAKRLMTETLSLSYGAPVKVEINDEKCQISYSGAVIEEIEPELVDVSEDTVTYTPKTTTTIIEETIAPCHKIDDFNDFPQYEIEHTSPQKLLAQIYNHLALPFVKDVNIKTFKEEQTIVPQLGLISSEKIHLTDAVYTEKDDETGLKNEIGNLQELTLQENISHTSNAIKYYTDIQLKNFNLVLPIFSLHLTSEHQATEIIYKNDEINPFDYTNLLQNLSSLLSSRSRAVAKGIRLKSDLLNMGIAYDMEIKSHADVVDNNTIKSTGNIAFNNISFTGDMLPKHQQPKSILLQMAINNLQLNNLVQLAQIQQETLSDDNAEIDEEKMIAVLDEILDTANFITDVRVNFAQANLTAHFDLYRKHDYLQGKGKITINNLFNIFPEIKACRRNPQAPQCTKNAILTELSPYIDILKNNSVSILKYTSTGVYLNNKKIAEPIKIDLHEMMQENDEESSAAEINADE